MCHGRAETVVIGKILVCAGNSATKTLAGLLSLVIVVCLLNGCAAGVSANSKQAPAQAAFQLSSVSINFGNVTVGKAAAQTVSVVNTGTVALHITQVSVSSAQFAVSGITTPAALGVGQTISLTLTLNASAAGAVTGMLTVTGDSGSSPEMASLSASAGAAAQPQLSMTPSSASFGDVTIGMPSTQAFQLTNSATGTLSITQINVTGNGFAAGTLSLPISLGAGQSSNFNVQFSPTIAGAVTGSVSVVSNATNAPGAIALSGTGVAATRTLSFSTTKLTFGSVNAGSSSSLPVTVTNTGNSSVQVSAITESGAGFTLAGASTPVTLSPKQSLMFNVSFQPTVAGADGGSVTVTSNASGSPGTISLSGAGVQATSHTVQLKWMTSSSTVSGYNVYRSTTNGSNYAKINGGLVSALNYSDSTVENGTTYYYVTTSVDASGTESSYSDQASAVIP